MRTGPIIWVDKISQVEERPDMGLRITFEIVDPVSKKRFESVLEVPPEGASAIRNRLILGVGA